MPKPEGQRLLVTQTSVLMIYKMAGPDDPMLDEEMIVAYNRNAKAMLLPEQSESGLRTRRSELVSMGKLVAHEKKRMKTGGHGMTYAVPFA